MGKKDSRVDAYIARSADFARPILNRIRRAVHAACPQVEETIKWGFPNFMHKGILCNMAAFKKHCSFGFWHRAMRQAVDNQSSGERAMGQFGRMTALSDLPKDRLFSKLLKQAVKLNDDGVKTPRPARPKQRRPLRIPTDFRQALRKNEKALKAFRDFSYSHRREYLDWITQAKRPETRIKRIRTTLKWLAQGKSQNWKYER